MAINIEYGDKHGYSVLDPNDPHWEIWNKYFSNFPNPEKYDSLVITTELMEKIREIDPTSSKKRVLYLLENPGLEYFSLHIQAKDGSPLYEIVYKRSYFRGKGLSLKTYAGETTTIHPLIDAFIVYYGSGTGRVYRLATFIASLPDTKLELGYATQPIWASSHTFGDLNLVMSYAAWFYLVIQELFHQRPVFCRETRRRATLNSTETRAHVGHGRKKKNKRHTVQIRTIRLTAEDVDACSSPLKRKYNRTKERWTVCGHERHLKSGKVIWIKPYEKGAKRGNPEGEYAAKDYKAAKEE